MSSEIGRLRQLASVRRGSPDNYGFAGPGWSEHIEGACGELVVCKFIGVYWDGSIDSFARADIGRSIQVRTRSKHSYELIVRPDDADDHIYVLVTGVCPKYTIRGYLYGRDAKKDAYLQTHGGRDAAYFVPHSALMSPYDLRSMFADSVARFGQQKEPPMGMGAGGTLL